MGWLWNSSPAPPNPADEAPQDQTPAPAPSQSRPTKRAAPSDDDVEVAKFLQEMMAEVKSVRESLDASKPPDSPAAATNPSSTTAPATKSTWASRWATSAFSSSAALSPTADDPSQTTTQQADHENIPDSKKRLSPLAESLLPTQMNCEQAFNLAYYCQSLGGQFTAVYRYGGMRSCSENWNDFWFCMRVKSYPAGEVKENMIREHYRNKELAKYGPGKPSSEDVWKERRTRVTPGEALSTPIEQQAQPMSDAELQKWEMERYERIRGELKGEKK